MTSIKNIVFDLGGVLLNLDIQKSLDAFRRLGITNIEDYFRIGHAASFFKQYEIGTINDEEFIAETIRLSHDGTKADDVLAAWNGMLLDFPQERVDLLKKLSGRYRLFLFSNTNALHLISFQQTYLDTYGTHIDDLFEKAYYSNVINQRKPDIKSFQFILEDSGLTAEETLFVDDALVNVEAARQAGMQAIHLEPGKTVLDLDWEL